MSPALQSRTRIRPAGRLCVTAVVLLGLGAPCLARAHGQPPYKDDRSTPAAVIESLYNAVDRHELVRACSYWKGSPHVASFEEFAKGYAQTARTRLYTGNVTSDGAAGSVLYRVPVAVRTVNRAGTTVVFAGCYTLRLVDPEIQAEPPFQPMHIVSGRLLRAKGRASQAVPDSCAN